MVAQIARPESAILFKLKSKAGTGSELIASPLANSCIKLFRSLTSALQWLPPLRRVHLLAVNGKDGKHAKQTSEQCFFHLYPRIMCLINLLRPEKLRMDLPPAQRQSKAAFSARMINRQWHLIRPAMQTKQEGKER
jgi:hypothetical protein